MSDIVVDTSAAFAILTSELGSEDLVEALVGAEERAISAGTAIELGIVLEARIGPAAPAIIERFLRDAGVDMVAVEREHVDRALEGWRRFGRGRHRAALNMGDLYAYGLAVSLGRPVLCTGSDFALTDVPVVGAEPG